MLTTIAYESGDIVLIPFPFTDQTASKRRPAIVVSSAAYHRTRPDLILMAVTSQVRPAASRDEVTITHWREAGLLKPSVTKPVLATVHRRLVLRKLGRLRSADRLAVQAVLDQILKP
jgi:mRNA interferase MazF